VQYLKFQRHLIFLGFIITLTSLIIVLPVNLKGEIAMKGKMEFQQTTILNLEKK